MKQKNQKLLAYGLCVIFACTGIAMVGWGWGTWSTKAATCCCDTTYWHHEGIRAEYFGCEDNSGKCETTSTLTITSEAEFGLFAWEVLKSKAEFRENALWVHQDWAWISGYVIASSINGDAIYSFLGQYIGEIISFDDWEIQLEADLDLSEHVWFPLSLSGITFHGNDYTISGLVVGEGFVTGHDICCCDTKTVGGLFGTLKDSVVQNLTLTDFSVDVSWFARNIFVGGIAGRIYDTIIDDVTLSGGFIWGSSCCNEGGGPLVQVGGITSNAYNSTIRNSQIIHGVAIAGISCHDNYIIGGLVAVAYDSYIFNNLVIQSEIVREAVNSTQANNLFVLYEEIGYTDSSVIDGLNSWVVGQNQTTPGMFKSWFICEETNTPYLAWSYGESPTLPGDNGNQPDEELNNTANITVIIIGSLFIVLVFAFIGFISVRQMQKRQTK